MPVAVSEQGLFQACQTLFGIENNISREFLEYLQLPGIKSAYRKKAFETHPDRAALNGGEAEQQNAELFRTIQRAYEDLTNYLAARENGFRFSGNQYKQRNGKTAHTSCKKDFQENHSSLHGNAEIEKLYTGPIPQRSLLFGHFLYYSGLINWRLIIQALLWQRTQRPRIGEIACKFGLFKAPDVLTILKNRKNMQPFGHTALDLGLLSESQLKIVIAHQLRLQKKFGAYFVENKLLSQENLQQLATEHQKHNAQFEPSIRSSHIQF
jgi:hypothetical protein